MGGADSIHALLAEGLVWQAESVSSAQPQQARLSVSSLRQQQVAISSRAIPFGLEAIDNALPQNGLSVAAVHEFCSLNVPLTLLGILAGNVYKGTQPNKFIIWVGEECWPSPFLLRRILPSQYLLSSCLFLAPKNKQQLLWAIDHALRSQAVALTIAYTEKLSFKDSRRFAVLAKRHKSILLLARNIDALSIPSAALTRWTLTPTPSPTLFPRWELALFQQKGAQAKERNWIIELLVEENKYRLKSQRAGIKPAR